MANDPEEKGSALGESKQEPSKPPKSPSFYGGSVVSANDDSTHVEKDLDALRGEIKSLGEDDRKAAESIDKIVLIGGPAAILASLTFMKDIAQTPVAGSVWSCPVSVDTYRLGNQAAVEVSFS